MSQYEPSHQHGNHRHAQEDIVFESPRGFVRYCRGCAAFELRFGNLILGMSSSDLADLCDTIAGFDKDSSPANADADHAVVWLGDTGTGFRFRREEVAELHRLLAGARLFAQLQSHSNPSDQPFD